MKRILLWLALSVCSLAQTFPWTGNSTRAWLAQSPNALSIPKAGTYITLSGQTNRLSVAGGVLLFDGSPIGGVTIYTGDGSLPTDRIVNGDGHLMSFSGNGLFLAESSNGSTIQGGTNLIGIANSGIEFRTPGFATANDGSVLTLNGGLVDYAPLSSTGGQTNWGIVVRDPVTDTLKYTTVTISDIINGGGPGGTNQNFANTDLTFTGNRTHEADGNSLQIQNFSDVYFYGHRFSFGATDEGTSLSMGDGQDFRLEVDSSRLFKLSPPSGLGTPGQVLTSDGSSADWADVPAGPNFANTDLTATGDRSHDFANHFLSIHDSSFISLTGSAVEMRSTGAGYGFYADTTGASLITPNYGSYVNGQVLTIIDPSGPYAEYLDPSFPKSGVPTVASGGGAGGSPTIALDNETDSAFTINLTAGTSPLTDDDIAIVTFASAYATPPHYSLASGNKATATLNGASQVWVTTTTTNLTLHSNATGLTATTNYLWEVIVVR